MDHESFHRNSDDRNVITEIFDGGNITTFLSPLGGVSMLQEVLSSGEEEKQEEELGSSYHPGIHFFMKYFNYASNL